MPSMDPAALRPSGRIHELDALRGLAALGVVFWHYCVLFHACPLPALFRPFYSSGYLLVDFFFVLSGFVIARAYWTPSRQHHLGRNVWARIARLYPLHLLTLLVTAVFVAALPGPDPDINPSTNDLRHFLLNLAMLNQSGLQDGFSFNIPAWSISTEFIVNISFLVFISMAVRTRWLAGAALALLAAIGLWRFHPPLIAGDRAFGVLDVYLFRCILGFGGGVAVYWLLYRWGIARKLASRPAIADLGAGLGLAGLTALMVATGRHAPVSHFLGSMALSVACVALVPFGRLTRRVLGIRPLVYLGDISYSVYLVHFPLVLALYTAAAHGLGPLDYALPPVLLAFVATVIAVASLTHRFVERTSQDWLLDLARRRPLPASS